MGYKAWLVESPDGPFLERDFLTRFSPRTRSSSASPPAASIPSTPRSVPPSSPRPPRRCPPFSASTWLEPWKRQAPA